MKRVIETVFNEEKFNADLEALIKKDICEQFQIDKFEYFENCKLVGPYTFGHTFIDDSQRKKQIIQQSRDKVISNLSTSQYTIVNKWIYLNSYFDKGVVWLIVCDEKGNNIQSIDAENCRIEFENE